MNNNGPDFIYELQILEVLSYATDTDDIPNTYKFRLYIHPRKDISSTSTITPYLIVYDYNDAGEVEKKLVDNLGTTSIIKYNQPIANLGCVHPLDITGTGSNEYSTTHNKDTGYCDFVNALDDIELTTTPDGDQFSIIDNITDFGTRETTDFVVTLDTAAFSINDFNHQLQLHKILLEFKVRLRGNCSDLYTGVDAERFSITINNDSFFSNTGTNYFVGNGLRTTDVMSDYKFNFEIPVYDDNNIKIHFTNDGNCEDQAHCIGKTTNCDKNLYVESISFRQHGSTDNSD